jgi:20S proteasome alpha/beta subunit
MTTIVYRDGVLAADARVVSKDFIYPEVVEKIFRLPDGSLLGIAGQVSNYDEIRAAVMENPNDLPKFKNNSMIRITPDGTIWHEDGGVFLKTNAPYMAIGSGEPYAWGALAVGASAEKAVAVAAMFNVGTGGPISVLKLNDEDGGD